MEDETKEDEPKKEESSKHFFTEAEIAKLADSSRNSVQDIKRNKRIKDAKLEAKIKDLIEFDLTIKQILLHSDFYDLCETAILKARKTSVRKLAVILQRFSEHARIKLNITEEDRTKEQ